MRAEFQAKGEKTHGKRIIIAGLITLALLLVVGKGISKYQSNGLHEYSSSRTLPSNTVFVPQKTKIVSSNQWYLLGETTLHTGTNDFLDFTNIISRDVKWMEE
ncbi:MAG: hypothetical protein PF795_13240 [Kiritimatiellae bacterium]|jgi:hypothetical protein|nr:hypothetical protein [Kiritimatiellia bacterium]